MFKFFKWFKTSNSQLDLFDIYHPKERLIYSYWDGEKEIKADPLTLYKHIINHGPELSVNLKVSSSPSKDASNHHDSLVKKIREIFKLKTLEENGLTEMEAIGLFDHFLTYCATIKKNSPPSVTSSIPMEDLKDSSQESQPILNSSDSGYVNKEFTTEEQEQSPMVQE